MTARDPARPAVEARLPADRRGSRLLRAAALQPDPVAVTPSDAPLLNIANALTMLRVVLVPVVVVVLFADGGHRFAWRVVAGVAFGLASATDRVDGQLARSRHLVTSFGKLVDPLADKALIGAAMISLSVLGDVAWWVTAVVLGREAGVTALRFWVIRHGVLPASRGGKVKAFLQALAIGLYLLPLGAGPMGVVRAVLLGLAVAVTVVTGLDYVFRALRLRQTSERAAMKRARRAAR